MVDRDVLERFLRSHAPSLVGPPATFLGVGDFATWDVGDEYIVRFAVDDVGDALLAREAAALSVIGAHVPVAVPTIDDVGEYDAGHRVVIYRKLPGPSGEERRPAGREVDAVAAQVADFLVALHAVRPADVPAPLPRHDIDHIDVRARLDEIAAYRRDIERGAGALLGPEMLRYLRGEVEVPTPGHVMRVCHTDLKGEHVLVDRASASLTGVIDWADIALDDPGVDYGALAIWLGPTFARKVAGLAAVSDEVVERGLFRNRTFLLIGYGKLLRGENSWPRALVETQLRWAFDDGSL